MKDIASITRELLEAIGENPDREGLANTPDRVQRMWAELTVGYRQDAAEIIKDAKFSVDYDEMVTVDNIPFYSLCEHHLLPFFGKVHVGYIPRSTVVGLSKIPRIVDMYARRLQVQERMATQIANTLTEHLDPQGVAVVIEGQHMCMSMRGVQKPGATMITSRMLGVFRDDERTRAEFLALIRSRSGS